ncbi:MAG: class I SAM-dependent methyltransferase, partial [Betaproteobacteria bacterium]
MRYVTEALHKLSVARSMIELRSFAVRAGQCPLCGWSILVRLERTDIGVRCIRCAASAITMAFVAVLKVRVPDLASSHVYELSSRGPLFEYLRTRAGQLTVSEYFDDVPLGSMKGGVQCEDVQKLTFDGKTFDVCTSTEVFEHVPDDIAGFAEIKRVLRPGGLFVFTVPLSNTLRTIVRAQRKDGSIEYLCAPEYHHDRIRGEGAVLVFRDYGRDITERLR